VSYRLACGVLHLCSVVAASSCSVEVVVDIVGVVGDVDDVGGTGITTDVADETV
jgi:hypothetical protein